MSVRRCVALGSAVTGLVLLSAACSSTTGLPSASIVDSVQTVSLFALTDPIVTTPSAFVLQGAQRVRIDQTTALDFAFTFDAQRRPILLPTERLGLGAASSLQATMTPFDAITSAPTTGWQLDSSVVVDPGAVVLVSSRPITCFTGLTVSLYAKLKVLAVDPTAQRLDFQILVDQNCGYRSLQPGLPTQ
jgi:hypothetical protein